MAIISIYNNKGGVGKSTITVGLAEFLSGNLKQKVLVIDLDAQASTTCALIGHQGFQEAVEQRRTMVDVITELHSTRRKARNLAEFIHHRHAFKSRGMALGEISLMVPDKERQIDVEEALDAKKDRFLMKKLLRPDLEKQFDYVLIDFPGNVSRRDLFAVNGMLMSDFVIVPILPTAISLNATPDTFNFIGQVQGMSKTGRPAILGMLKNMTDHRTEQAKTNLGFVKDAASQGDLPPIFKNFWPPASAFQTSTDEKAEFRTLQQKYGTYYDKARLVAKELHKRCQEYQFPETTGMESESFTKRFVSVMNRFLASKPKRAAAAKA